MQVRCVFVAVRRCALSVVLLPRSCKTFARTSTPMLWSLTTSRSVPCPPLCSVCPAAACCTLSSVLLHSTYNAVAQDFPLSARQVLQNLQQRAQEVSPGLGVWPSKLRVWGLKPGIAESVGLAVGAGGGSRVVAATNWWSQRKPRGVGVCFCVVLVVRGEDRREIVTRQLRYTVATAAFGTPLTGPLPYPCLVSIVELLLLLQLVEEFLPRDLARDLVKGADVMQDSSRPTATTSAAAAGVLGSSSSGSSAAASMTAVQQQEQFHKLSPFAATDVQAAAEAAAAAAARIQQQQQPSPLAHGMSAPASQLDAAAASTAAALRRLTPAAMAAAAAAARSSSGGGGGSGAAGRRERPLLSSMSVNLSGRCVVQQGLPGASGFVIFYEA